jgi:hypothetical protein
MGATLRNQRGATYTLTHLLIYKHGCMGATFTFVDLLSEDGVANNCVNVNVAPWAPWAL